jgi:hypothetical protein
MYVGSRFGQDTKSRIAASTSLLLEATEMPAEPSYQQLVPFLPEISSGSGVTTGGLTTTASSGDTDEWKVYPDRLDLYVYQGDDIQIPLYFINAAEPTLDMSTWDWKAQARITHRYYVEQSHEFIIDTELITPTAPDTVNQTLVTLFLPRYRNRYVGLYSWELYSTSPYVGPTFVDPPPDVLGFPPIPDEEWPPVDQVKTWVYGRLYVVPRSTTTDWLPVPDTAVHASQGMVVQTFTGTYGPNGRVP